MTFASDSTIPWFPSLLQTIPPSSEPKHNHLHPSSCARPSMEVRPEKHLPSGKTSSGKTSPGSTSSKRHLPEDIVQRTTIANPRSEAEEDSKPSSANSQSQTGSKQPTKAGKAITHPVSPKPSAHHQRNDSSLEICSKKNVSRTCMSSILHQRHQKKQRNARSVSDDIAPGRKHFVTRPSSPVTIRH
jgi:hypothetical protein